MQDKSQRDRLETLIGHDLIINLLHDAHDAEGIPSGIPPGRLREVGLDYLVLETRGEEEGGFAGEGAEWFASLKFVKSIIHMVPECTGCIIDATVSGSLGQG